MGLVRVSVQSVVEGALKRFSAQGRENETFTDREFMQHYGFSSRPIEGAEGIILNEGNHIVMVASEDRRYRISVEAGEVALYSDEGDSVHLKRNREIHIKGGKKVRIESESVEIVSTNGEAISFTGDISVDGSISASGSIVDSSGNTNHHSH